MMGRTFPPFRNSSHAANAASPRVLLVAFSLLVAAPLVANFSVCNAETRPSLELLLTMPSRVYSTSDVIQAEVVIRNPNPSAIFVNPDLLPAPWKDAQNFPISIIEFEVVASNGEVLPYVGDGSAGVLDPVFPGFDHLLALPEGAFLGRTLSLTQGRFAVRALGIGHYSVRARFLSRARSWLKLQTPAARRARGNATPEDTDRVFEGEVVSNTVEIDVVSRQ